jgi:hypothetical protein
MIAPITLTLIAYLIGVVVAFYKRRDLNRIDTRFFTPLWVIFASWVAVVCLNSELKN